MTIRNLMLRAYPRPWRAEFGPELADILATKKLTAMLIADVLVSAALQHFRQDPWKICAVGLSLWTGVLITISQNRVVNRQEMLCLYFGGQLVLFTAGAWTGLRSNCGIWSATIASLKAAAVPIAASNLLNAITILRYWLSFSGVFAHAEYDWVWKNGVVMPIREIWDPLLATILVSLLFGLAGASVARLIQVLRRKSRESIT